MQDTIHKPVRVFTLGNLFRQGANNVIDGRYRSHRPLIVTTNLTLSELQNPADRAHQRIYDRVLAMCTSICCSGINFRKEQAQKNMEYLKGMLK